MLKYLSIRKFDFLVSLYIFCIVATELMGAKTVPLFKIGGYQLNGSVSLLLLPLVYSINDVITEVFGKERTKSLIRSGIVMVLLTLLCSVIFTGLPASTRFAPTEAAYETVFQVSARFSLASLIAFIISEFTDVYIFAMMRQKLGQSRLWLRNNLSNFVSEFLDTAIFMVLAFWAFDKGLGDNVSFIVSISLPYYLLRCVMSIIETPLVYAGVKWLRNEKTTTEGVSRDGQLA